jgi:Apea-like HEPN
MSHGEAFNVEFHPDAAARFNELADEILGSVRSFGRVEPPHNRSTPLHPVIELGPADIIGEITVQQSSVDLLGEERARYWQSKGVRVGWEGADFEKIKELARRIARVASIAGRVSDEFMLDEVFLWLRETLERQRSNGLTDYLAHRCSSEIKDREIWIPVYRTYSTRNFTMGDVEFLTITAPMMDRWFARFLQNVEDKRVSLEVNRERSIMQGSLAARIRVKAELKQARAIANAAATKAIGFLRFLSPVNSTCKLVSYCAPVGKESTIQTMELIVENDLIASVEKASVEQGPAAWNVDVSVQTWSGLLELVQKLASGPQTTKFRGELYEAVQLHSRHSVAVEIPHKIVFVVAAIESLLLKDSSEPIQKNLGERMAFIIGSTVSNRKPIIRNVDEFYQIRSALIHHGYEIRPKDFEVIDKFFFNVWWCFVRLLNEMDNYKTREELFEALEEKKLR